MDFQKLIIMEESDFDEMDRDHLDRLFEEDDEINWDDPMIFDTFDDD